MKKEIWLSEGECTGCGACENACPKGVLKVELCPGGHLLPVAYEGCIGCDRCVKACEARLSLPARGTEKPAAYAAWSNDAGLRFASTSGGLFSELALPVIADGGAVYGAAYGEACRVAHAKAETPRELECLRQSKYVQSEIGLSFRAVRDDLRAGRKVLFCGAPCQVAGLRAYLGKDYEGLYLVDFVCRGVNSPLAYRYWLDGLASEQGSEVSRVWFKYKEGGWKTSPLRTRIDFEDGERVVLEGKGNTYMRGYLESNLYFRRSCAQCEFKGFPRQGDVTVADFWGLDPDLDDDRGASMVLVSSDKGRELLEAAAPRVTMAERAFDEIFAGNVCIGGSAPLSEKSVKFMAALPELGFEAALSKYGRKGLAERFAGKAKAIVRRLVRHG